MKKVAVSLCIKPSAKKFSYNASDRLYQDVFGLVKAVTIVDYVVQRLKSALYEEWTEDEPVLRKCVRQGFVNFGDYRALLTDLIDLWPSIRPYIRCTGNPESKEKADSVSMVCLIVVSWG